MHWKTVSSMLLLFAFAQSAPAEIFGRNAFMPGGEGGAPQGWRITVQTQSPDAKKPEPPAVVKGGVLQLFAGDGGCEVTCQRPRMQALLKPGRWRMQFTVEGDPACAYRGILMYLVDGKWLHTDADFHPVPEKAHTVVREFELPKGIAHAYFYFEVRRKGSAKFSNLSLAPASEKTAFSVPAPPAGKTAAAAPAAPAARMPQAEAYTPKSFAPCDPAELFDAAELLQAPKWIDSPYPDSDVENLRAVIFDSRADGGKPTKVFAYIGFPEGTPPEGGFPAVVLAHGGTGTAFAEYVKQWNRRGYAAIAPDFYGNRPDGQDPRKRTPLEGGVYRLDEWVVRSAEAIVRAHSLLRSLPGVNVEKTALVGISWGGVFSTVAAAVDHRFRGAVAVYGCGYWSEGDRSLIFTRWSDAPFDPKYFLASIRTPFYWVAGTNDTNFGIQPLECTMEHTATTENRTLLPNLPHGHLGFLFPAVTRSVDHLLRGGAPLPKLGEAVVEGDSISAPVLDPGKGILDVTLVYTADAAARQSERKWQRVPAQMKFNRVTARVPAGTVQCYLTAADEPQGGELECSGATGVVNLRWSSEPSR